MNLHRYRLFLAPWRAVLTLAIGLVVGCSGGGSSGTPEPAENVAPSVELGQSLRVTSGTFVIDPQASDRNRDALSFAWTLLDGPSGAYLAGQSSGSGATPFVVPLNGVYTFEVAVSDGAHSVTSRTTVTVEDPDAFRYEGRLLTAGVGESGIEAQLFWSQAGVAVLSTRTSASGSFQFPAVLGVPGDFTVQLAGSSVSGP